MFDEGAEDSGKKRNPAQMLDQLKLDEQEKNSKTYALPTAIEIAQYVSSLFTDAKKKKGKKSSGVEGASDGTAAAPSDGAAAAPSDSSTAAEGATATGPPAKKRRGRSPKNAAAASDATAAAGATAHPAKKRRGRPPKKVPEPNNGD